MVSITLSVPEETRKKMKQFPEVNWSALIRKIIEEKTEQLTLKEELLKQLKEDNESGFTDWTVKMGRKLKEEHYKNTLKEAKNK